MYFKLLIHTFTTLPDVFMSYNNYFCLDKRSKPDKLSLKEHLVKF